MNDRVNAYELWLGISHKSPNYYQLLGLREHETDIEKIRAAADRAIARVRAHRPGSHAAQWAELLDLLKRVRTELTDPQTKQVYDTKLRGRSDASTPKRSEAKKRDTAAGQPRAATTRGDADAKSISRKKATSIPAEIVDELPDFSPTEISTTSGATAPAPNTLDPMAPIDPDLLVASTAPAAIASQPPFATGTNSDAAAAGSAAPLVRAAKRRANRSSTPLVLVAGICLGVLLTVVGVIFKDRLFNRAGQSAIARNEQESASANHSDDAAAANRPSPSQATTASTDATTSAATSADSDNSSSSDNDAEEPMDDEPAETTTDDDMPVEDPADTKTESEPQESTSAPEPTDDTPPVPEPAEDEPTPATLEELKQLSAALIAARTALQTQDFETASEKISEASQLAKSPEHQEMVARLEKIAAYLKRFREGIDRAMRTLEAGLSFSVSDDVIVAVVERKPDAIVVKVAGRNQTYQLNQLPLKLGLAMVDQGLQGDSDTRLIKGAFQALHPRATAEHITEVRKWWEDAGEEGAALLPFLDDKYEDLDKEAMKDDEEV